jgi:hypothetical protein
VTLGRHLALMGLEALVGGAILASSVLWPVVPKPSKADAVVLLSGDAARLDGALRLMNQGVAPTLVFVGMPDTPTVAAICDGDRGFEVVCLRPSPDDTRSEAEAVGALAEARRWDALAVVTSRYHIVRARLLLRRCFAGRIQATGEVPTYGRAFNQRQIQHELLGLAYATFVLRRC